MEQLDNNDWQHLVAFMEMEEENLVEILDRLQISKEELFRAILICPDCKREYEELARAL